MTIVHRLLNLNWVVAILFPLTVILVEVFWLYPWLLWAGRWPVFTWQHPSLSLVSVILLIGTSFLSARFFLNQKWSLHWSRLCIVSCGLLATFLVIRVEYGAGFELLDNGWFVHIGRIILSSFSQLHPMVMALPVAAYLWWRGISLGRASLYADDIYRSFLIGLVALVMLIIVWRVSLSGGSLQSLSSTIGLYVVGFFLFGLMALALSHLQTIRQKLPEKETARALARRWLYSMLGLVGGILLVGIGTTSIFSAGLAVLLERLWNLIYQLLLQALHYLFIPIGYVIEGRHPLR